MQMHELSAFLKAHDDYIILGHINPDGDASGSCIALALGLKQLGKRAFVYLPGGLPKMYSAFDCPVDLASDGAFPFEPLTAFSVDVSDPERLGSGRAYFEACESKAVLDHHATNAGFGDVCYVDGDAAACGELALALIGELGVELTQEMAGWLYIAICTDSGQFAYSSTRPQTMEAAAACLRAGANPDEITRELYRTRSEGRVRLLGAVLSRMEMNGDKTMCWSSLTEEIFRQAGALREDNEGAVNYLLEIRGVEFACLAEERGVNQTKFSLRSKGMLDVAEQVARPLGGGGHARAAGVTLNLPMEEALARVLETAQAALNEAKK